jgi:spore germination protein GerM
MRSSRLDRSAATALLTLVVLFLAGCGDSNTPSAATATSTTVTYPVSTTPSPEPSDTERSTDQTTYEVWFADGEHLFPALRTEPSDPAPGAAAMSLLLEGPTADERDLGVATLIPDGTELLGLDIDSGLATVDLSSGFESGGGSLSMQMRLAQVVYTLTQFSSVHGVNFRLDGEPVETFSGEGIVLDKPQTRKGYKDLLPAILVETPKAGERVKSPVRVAGTANVFEANVSIRIVDSDGNRLKETFTTATCGTGCRGDYSEDVSFKVTSETQGYIEVYEASAEDGSDTNLVRIPVTLLPN